MGRRRRRVRWTQRALDSLDEALSFVAAESPASAEGVLIRVLDAAVSLHELTERGRVVPELQDPNVRELVIPPYRLIYDYDASSVWIVLFCTTLRNSGFGEPIRSAGRADFGSPHNKGCEAAALARLALRRREARGLVLRVAPERARK